MKDTKSPSQLNEIRKGGVGVNVLASGATAPRGPLSSFTNKPGTSSSTSVQSSSTQGQKS